MTYLEDTAAIRNQIAKAEQQRDGYLAAGMQEKYLQAHSMVEALELQFDQQHQALVSANRKRERMLVDVRIKERIRDNAECAMADEPDSRAQLMLAFDIEFDGRQYVFGGYRYDRLADAANYARIRDSCPSSEAIQGSVRIRVPVETPSDSQRHLMRALGITFEDGVYHLESYRYDRLFDAVEYARLKAR